jgi:hypothetical protein
MSDERLPSGLDLTVPSAARMYDYYLGGKDNFEVDRERAEQIISAYPEVRAAARANRQFLARAVHAVAESGVRQFLDLGAGLPTQGPVHEIVRQVHPDARVVYVDNDPIACAHARALVAGSATAVVEADVRDPAAVLGDEQVTGLLDWDEPVAVLFMAVLHFIGDEDDPAGMVAAYTRDVAPGSHLLISHVSVALDTAAYNKAAGAYQGSGTGDGNRTPEQIAAFFEGFRLLEPGLVDAVSWRSGVRLDHQGPGLRLLAGVGVR